MAIPIADLDFNSLRRMRWSDDDYAEIQQYLKDKTFPGRIGQKEYSKRSEFKKKAIQFTLNESGQIVLIVNGYPEWALDKATKKPLYQMKIPFTMMVVKESDVVPTIKMFWGDAQTNGYRGAAAFHDRVQHEFLGISRRVVGDALKTFEVHQMSMAGNAAKVVNPIITTEKMQHWEIDLVEFRTVSTFNNGINYLLNVIDINSKFAWSRPLKSKATAMVAFEMQQIFMQEGSPQRLSSDNGTEFTGKEMQELMALRDIDHRFSEAYKPQTNGAVERFNQTLKEALNRYCADHGSKRFIDALQSLVESYNTTKHNTTKQTPFQSHRGIDARASMLASMRYAEIKRAAAKMVSDSEKRITHLLEPLHVGDTVRLDVLAIKSVRKMKDFMKKARGITTYTKELFHITEEKEDEHGLMLFQIDPTPAGEKASRWYSRKYFNKIDPKSLVKAKAISDKRDLNFGQGGFDLERHLVEIPRAHHRIARMGEDEMERAAAGSSSAAASSSASSSASVAAGRAKRAGARQPGFWAGADDE